MSKSGQIEFKAYRILATSMVLAPFVDEKENLRNNTNNVRTIVRDHKNVDSIKTFEENKFALIKYVYYSFFK